MALLHRSWLLKWVPGLVVCGLLAACSARLPLAADTVPLSSCFDEQARVESANALIYVWSPRMVLSAVEARQSAQAAQATGLAFVPVVDGRLPVAEWQAALQTLARIAPESAKALQTTRSLCLSTLVDRDGYRHFPTAFVQVNRQLHPSVLVGAMPFDFWREGLRLRLQNFHP